MWRPELRKQMWKPLVVKYNPDQPRAANGEFGSNADANKLHFKNMDLKDVKPKDIVSHLQHGTVRVSEINHKDNKGQNYYQIKGTTKEGSKVSFYMSGNTQRLVSQHADNKQDAAGPKPNSAGAKQDANQEMKMVSGKDVEPGHVLFGTGFREEGFKVESATPPDKNGGVYLMGKDVATGRVQAAYIKADGGVMVTEEPKVASPKEPENSAGKLKAGDYIYAASFGEKEPRLLQVTDVDKIGDGYRVYCGPRTVDFTLEQEVTTFNPPNKYGTVTSVPRDQIAPGDTIISNSNGALTVLDVKFSGDQIKFTTLNSVGSETTYTRVNNVKPLDVIRLSDYSPVKKEPKVNEAIADAFKPDPQQPQQHVFEQQEPQYTSVKQPLSAFQPGDIIAHPNKGDVTILDIISKPNGNNAYQIKGTDSSGEKVSFYLSGTKDRVGKQLAEGGAVVGGVIVAQAQGDAGKFVQDLQKPGAVVPAANKREELAKAIPLLTTNQTTGIRAFCNGAYSSMNIPLRKGTVPSDEYQKKVNNTHEALNVRPTTLAVSVVRKVGFDGVRVNADTSVELTKNQVLALQPGTVLRDRGFQSTSIRDNAWSGPVWMRYTLPKGTPAAYVASISPHKGEKEVLLDKNLASIVTKVVQGPGYVEVYATIVPPEMEKMLIPEGASKVSLA